MTGMTNSGSSTSFQCSGLFTIAAARWHFQDYQKLAFNWTVTGPDTLRTIELPVLSPVMQSMFPTLSLDSMQLYQFEFTHFPSIKSYNSYLDQAFGQPKPGAIRRLTNNSVRIQAD
jgi:hypothetical protein